MTYYTTYETFKLDKHGNPKVEAFDYFLEKIEKVFVTDKRLSVNMYEREIPEKYSCGSVACFGGAICVAFGVSATNHQRRFIQNYYADGALIMNHILGFGIKDCIVDCKLRDWAASNTEIWGNKYGFRMFNDPKAFDSTNESITTEVIFNYLKGVRNRLEKCV